MARRYHYVLFITILSIITLLTACSSPTVPNSSSVSSETNTTNGAFPIEVTDSTGRAITFETPPHSVAVLSTGDMNIIQSLKGNLTGRPSTTQKLSEELQSIQELGNTHQPNIEQIAALAPDLMIAPSGFERYAPALENQGVTVYISASNSIDEIIGNILTYGKILGKESIAQGLVDSLQTKITALEKQTSESSLQPNVLLVYGAPGSYLAALPSSLAGDILEKAGARNVAEQYPKLDQYPGYAQLSVERIVESNPDIVMLITHGDPEDVEQAFNEEMAKNPGWKNLDAVKNGKVSILPSDLFGVNPGSRIVEALDYATSEIANVQLVNP